MVLVLWKDASVPPLLGMADAIKSWVIEQQGLLGGSHHVLETCQPGTA